MALLKDCRDLVMKMKFDINDEYLLMMEYQLVLFGLKAEDC